MLRILFIFAQWLIWCPLLFAHTPQEPQAESDLSWYEDFYSEISHQNIRSLRYFQIWVTPGQKFGVSVTPIGGSSQAYQQWQENMQQFFEAYQYYGPTCGATLNYELIIDRGVYQAHQELLDAWKSKYPELFRLTLIENAQPAIGDPMAIGYEQCKLGIAAVCSDWWRASHLYHPDFEVSVYFDIDTLTQALTEKGQKSSQVLGLHSKKGGISLPFDEKVKNLYWNNDFLISWDPEPQQVKKIQAHLEHRLLSQKAAYHDIARQFHRAEIASFSQYQKDLSARIETAFHNPEQNIARYSLIMREIGPNFWGRLSQEKTAQLSRDTASERAMHTWSWLDERSTLSYQLLNTEILSDYGFTQNEKETVVQLVLMLLDRPLLKKRIVSWLKDFEAAISEESLSNQALIDSLPQEFAWLKCALEEKES